MARANNTMRRTAGRYPLAIIVVAVIACSLMGIAHPAGAASVITVARVDTGSSGAANVRRGPSTSAAVVRTVPHGSWLELTCSTRGSTVYGRWGPTDLWYLTTSGGFVSDSVIYTGTNLPVVAACSAGQAGAGGTSAIPVASAATGGVPLNIRVGPSTTTSVIRTQRDGSYVELNCSIRGQAVSGQWGTTTLWYRLVGGGYVSDAVIFTGTNSPIAPPCRAPSTPSGSAIFVATGGPPLNRRVGPATWETIIGTIPDGAFLNLDCAVYGQVVWGAWGPTDLWYRLIGGGYVTDGLIFTGSNEAVRPMCSGGAGTPVSAAARARIAQSAEAELSSGKAWERDRPFPLPPETSPRVNEYLAFTGLGAGKPWCAAFASWVVNHPVGVAAGTTFRSAAVGDWVRAARRLQYNLRVIPASAIQPGDLVAIDEDGGSDFYGSSHMGVVVKAAGGGTVTSIDGNTYPQGQPGGGFGLYKRTRALTTTAGSSGEMIFLRVGG